jgi:hypothetical protein
MMTKTTMNMCGTDGPEGRAQTSVRPSLLRELPRHPGVVDVAEEEHEADRGQDAAEGELVGQAHDELQEPRHHQEVDEDVRAEAEEGVPVARRPEVRRLGLHVAAPPQ